MKTLRTKISALLCILSVGFVGVAGETIIANQSGVVGSVGVIIGAIVSVLIVAGIGGSLVNMTKNVTRNTNIDASTKSMTLLLPFGVALVTFIALFSFLL